MGRNIFFVISVGLLIVLCMIYAESNFKSLLAEQVSLQSIKVLSTNTVKLTLSGTPLMSTSALNITVAFSDPPVAKLDSGVSLSATGASQLLSDVNLTTSVLTVVWSGTITTNTANITFMIKEGTGLGTTNISVKKVEAAGGVDITGQVTALFNPGSVIVEEQKISSSSSGEIISSSSSSGGVDTFSISLSKDLQSYKNSINGLNQVQKDLARTSRIGRIFSNKFKRVIKILQSALKRVEESCEDRIDTAVSRIDSLSSQLETRRCSKRRSKSCVLDRVVDKVVATLNSVLNNIETLMQHDIDESGFADICD